MGNAASQQQVDTKTELFHGPKESQAQLNETSTTNKEETVSKQEYNDNDKSMTREQVLQQHPRLRDVLKEIGETSSTIKAYEDNDIAKKTISSQVVRTLKDLYGYYFEYDQREHRQMIGDALATSGAVVPFLLYLNILTDDCTDYPLERDEFDCYQVLRSLLWNYSDTSLQFADEIGRSGMLSVMLKDLQKFQNSFKGSDAQGFIVLSAMSVLLNCSKSSNNAKYYREINAVETVAWYAKNTSEIPGMEVLAPMSALTLAHIVEEKDNDIITTDNSLIQTILRLISGAIATPDHMCDGFSAVELVEGLTKLASNADNSAVIMQLGIIKYIVQLMNEGNVEEKTSVCKLAWVLAFSEKNKLELKENTEIVIHLKKFAESENKTLKSAASGALWVLRIRKAKQKKMANKKKQHVTLFANAKDAVAHGYEEEEFDDIYEEVPEANPAEAKPEEAKSHVMVSYQWDHQKLMIRLKTRLEELGYKTWMDIDEMGGSTLQSMAEAVENAAVVLVCLSQKYKDSVSCRTEAEYAYKRNKKIIPLRLEHQYEPDGWLGAILGAKLYFDFSNLSMFETTMSGLIKELGSSGKSAAQRWNVVKAVAPVLQKRRGVGDWTNKEVKKWAEDRKLNSFQTKDVDGRVLLFLRQLKQVAPEFFYNRVSDQHGLKNIRDLMIFSEALDDLS